jgi:light-regulated signal transduction histidine kinase (bacteriophytochrome)
MQYRIILGDGSIKYLRYIGRPSFDSKGNLVRRFGAVMDVTETKTAQIKLEATLKELERSNRELEQFAYAASHDLQEPMRMMKGFSDLLQRRFKSQVSDPKILEFLGFISEGADRMQALISDLLTYSRVTTRGTEFKTVDLEKVLEKVIRNIQFSMEENHAEILNGRLPVVKADETQMGQLFQNLLSNAIKFRGEKDPQIKIGYTERESEWEVSVKDNGIGIDPQFRERIFVIFQRLHERETYPGTGIGLALCKKIIERHGGRIWVESEPGKGANFYFTIPK